MGFYEINIKLRNFSLKQFSNKLLNTEKLKPFIININKN